MVVGSAVTLAANRKFAFCRQESRRDLPGHHQRPAKFKQSRLRKAPPGQSSSKQNARKIPIKTHNNPLNNKTPLVRKPPPQAISPPCRPRVHAQLVRKHEKIQYSEDRGHSTWHFGVYRQLYSAVRKRGFDRQVFPLD